MSLNHNLLGKEYPPQDYGVTEEAIIKYARAYNEDNSWFLDASRPGGVIAPPMFGVVMSWLPLMLIVTDSELGVDLLRLLHSAQDMYFYQLVIPGDIVTSAARISAIEEKSTGESFTVEVTCTNQRGELVQRILFTAFIRKRNSRGKFPERVVEATPSGEPLLQVCQRTDVDQTYRYAEASGDHNPIHTDESVAKLAGLPGIIMPGLCTMAFTSKVMIDRLCGHDPRRLKRLRARFSRPVSPGQAITTAVWPGLDREGLKVYTYETYNPKGEAVIKGGVAEVAAS
jgi:acyl dehydratase